MNISYDMLIEEYKKAKKRLPNVVLTKTIIPAYYDNEYLYIYYEIMRDYDIDSIALTEKFLEDNDIDNKERRHILRRS